MFRFSLAASKSRFKVLISFIWFAYSIFFLHFIARQNRRFRWSTQSRCTLNDCDLFRHFGRLDFSSVGLSVIPPFLTEYFSLVIWAFVNFKWDGKSFALLRRRIRLTNIELHYLYGVVCGCVGNSKHCIVDCGFFVKWFIGQSNWIRYRLICGQCT